MLYIRSESLLLVLALSTTVGFWPHCYTITPIHMPNERIAALYRARWESAFNYFYFYFTNPKPLSKTPRECGVFVYCERP